MQRWCERGIEESKRGRRAGGESLAVEPSSHRVVVFAREKEGSIKYLLLLLLGRLEHLEESRTLADAVREVVGIVGERKVRQQDGKQREQGEDAPLELR